MKKKYSFETVIEHYKKRKKIGGTYPSYLLDDAAYYSDIKHYLLSRQGHDTSRGTLFLDFIHVLCRTRYIVRRNYVKLFITLYERNKDNPDKKIIYEIVECIGKLCDFNGIAEPQFKDVLEDALKRYSEDDTLLYIILYAIWVTNIPNAEQILKRYRNHHDSEIRQIIEKGLAYFDEQRKKQK